MHGQPNRGNQYLSVDVAVVAVVAAVVVHDIHRNQQSCCRLILLCDPSRPIVDDA